MNKKMNSAQYLNDLENIFKKALNNKNFAAAVKAKELQAKEWDKDPKNSSLSLKQFSAKDILCLLEELENEQFPELDAVKKEIANLEEALEKQEQLQHDLQEKNCEGL